MKIKPPLRIFFFTSKSYLWISFLLCILVKVKLQSFIADSGVGICQMRTISLVNIMYFPRFHWVLKHYLNGTVLSMEGTYSFTLLVSPRRHWSPWHYIHAHNTGPHPEPSSHFSSPRSVDLQGPTLKNWHCLIFETSHEKRAQQFATLISYCFQNTN